MPKSAKYLIILVLLFLYDLIFWNEKIGINLSLFSLLLLMVSLRDSISRLKREEIIIPIAVAMLSGIMVIWHNTATSIAIHLISVIISLGLIKQKELTSSLEGVPGFIVTYFNIPFNLFGRIQSLKSQNRSFRFLYSLVKLAIIPLILFVLFFVIYQAANPKFQEMTSQFTLWVSSWLENLSIGRIIFITFGFSFIIYAWLSKGYQLESLIGIPNQLKRKGKRTFLGMSAGNLLAELINEHKMALIVFSLLNVLLLVVNIIDISWIWFDFEVPLEFNLKQFVHEGTYLLIFSILLSMAIVLYFFRYSLNFYPKNRTLKILTKIWIIQNAILAISVFIRNFHYIDYHGLASKRIGVIAFLLMTVFGLMALIIKVDKKKTFAYLIRKNAHFVLITIGIMSCISWDHIIVNYNLSHNNPSEIDVDYYLQLSPSTIPIVLDNIAIVESQMDAHLKRDKEVWLDHLDIYEFQLQLEDKLNDYQEKQKEYGFWSWNYADHKLMNSKSNITASR